MGRTRLSSKRSLEQQETNIGHIIIFCEGKTEKHYFDYFNNIVKKDKFNKIEIFTDSENIQSGWLIIKKPLPPPANFLSDFSILYKTAEIAVNVINTQKKL